MVVSVGAFPIPPIESVRVWLTVRMELSTQLYRGGVYPEPALFFPRLTSCLELPKLVTGEGFSHYLTLRFASGYSRVYQRVRSRWKG